VLGGVPVPALGVTHRGDGRCRTEGRIRDQGSRAEGEGQRETGRQEQKEIDLGEFKVTSFQPASNTTTQIRFHLFGTVSASDVAEFTARMKENQHRFREQVIVTIRSAEMTDLTDAGLGLLKRTILEKTNALLGKTLVKAVIISDFSFMES